MYEVLFETTAWDLDYQPNFTYLAKSNRIFAYIRPGFGAVYFKHPMLWNRKGRKFAKLKGNPFDMKKVNYS